MSKKIKKIADLVLVVGFLGFIYYVSARTTYTSLSRAAHDLKIIRSENRSYKELSKKIKELRNFPRYAESSIYRKNDFINLNGLVARCLGMNSLNRVQKHSNGFLTGFSGTMNPQKIEESAKEVAALNNFLAERGIPFLYILVPGKNSFYEDQFRVGYGDESKQNITIMIDALNAAGVENINMDAWFKENGWHIEDAYFKTDGHWKPEAGFAAARCAMELLQKKGIARYDKDRLQDKSYEKDVLKEWFLGSQGKRTGRYYGGADDITIYYPKFETDYFYAGLRKDTTNWEFSESVLDLSYAEKKDYFGTNPYCIYMHRDYPLRITINTKALNEKNLLLLGDSFKMIAEYFLTTQFRKVHTIDLRYNTDINFAQHLEEIKPDIVIMCLNEGAIINEKINTFGVDEYLAALEKTDPSSPVQNFGDFELRAGENNEKFVGVCGNLEPNQTYTLTVDRTAMSGVEHSFVQMTLQNLSTNKAIFNRYFESNSGARQKWIFTTPEGDDAYGIFLYAGTKGHTSGIDAKVEGIALRKGIFED